jgi:hypothetical protein
MQDLDRILDAALKSYVEEPAPLGIERRVLGRIRRPKPWLIWLPAAAVLVAAAGLLLTMTTTQKQAPIAKVAPPHVEIAEAPAVKPLLPQPRKHRRVALKPRPTEQQLALADFARKYPEQALAMVTHGEVVPLEVQPLEIPELKIEAIKTEELTQ